MAPHYSFPILSNHEITACLGELHTLPKTSVVESRLTAELLSAELTPLRALGGVCRVVVSGPASFNGAVKKKLAACGVEAQAVTILEA